MSDSVKGPVALRLGESDRAELLLRWASYEAERRHGSVYTLYLPDAEHANKAGRGCQVLDKAVRRLLGGRDWEVVHVYPGPRESIEVEVSEPGEGMIIVGPIDSNRLVDLVFRTADDLGDGPVVVVPGKALATGPPLSGPPTITVGFHGSAPSAAALDWAITEAQRRGASVKAVLAWMEGPNGALCGAVPIDLHRHALAGRAAGELAAATVAATGVPVERVIPVARRGDPARVLVDEAADSDMLALGAGQSIVHEHRLLGATALGCINRSPVPVAIVRHLKAETRLRESRRPAGQAVDREQARPSRP